MKKDVIIPLMAVVVVAYTAVSMACIPMCWGLALNIALVAIQASALALVMTSTEATFDQALVRGFCAGNAICLVCQVVFGSILVGFPAEDAALVIPMGIVLLVVTFACDALALRRATALEAN